jgi:L-aminopeptidase/D-esterase-like protein
MLKITDIEGFKIGNAQNVEAGTGCTVIICENGAVAGVDVRGGAPGTRETDLLDPGNLVDKIHAVVLSGGSSYGLDAASGVMQYLEERKIGYAFANALVPIVCSAILFDLNCGNPQIRPDKKMGYEACINAQNGVYQDGNFGAGTGATIGKIKGPAYAMKGGIGSCCLRAGDLTVGAIAAVNCLGDIFDSSQGKIIAGVLNDDKNALAHTEKIISDYPFNYNIIRGNTTIGAILTNACLSKAEANKLATMAHDGYARSIRPSHTLYDGDLIFTMTTNLVPADLSLIGSLAANAMEKAVLQAVKQAKTCYGYLAYSDLKSI